VRRHCLPVRRHCLPVRRHCLPVRAGRAKAQLQTFSSQSLQIAFPA
jgi:hypothetical protein